jgi:hypothetical protein
MKVTIIKGPNHEKTLEQAYRFLSKILSKKAKEMEKTINRPLRFASVRFYYLG